MNVGSSLTPVRDSFRALTRAVIPASSGLDEAGWRRAEEIVDDALRARSASVRRQVVLFVRALGMLSWVRHGRSLATLDPDRMQRFLRSFERSPLLLVRRGFWGIRTLAFMGYYGQSEVRADLGYRADPGGWEHRGGGQGPWAGRRGAGVPEPQALVVGDEGIDRGTAASGVGEDGAAGTSRPVGGEAEEHDAGGDTDA